MTTPTTGHGGALPEAPHTPRNERPTSNDFESALVRFMERASRLDGRRIEIAGGTSQFVHLVAGYFYEPTADGSMPSKRVPRGDGAVLLRFPHCDVRRRDGEISCQARHPAMRGAGPRVTGPSEYGATIYDSFPAPKPKPTPRVHDEDEVFVRALAAYRGQCTRAGVTASEPSRTSSGFEAGGRTFVLANVRGELARFAYEATSGRLRSQNGGAS